MNIISSAIYISGQLARLHNAVGADDQPVPLTRYIGGQNRKTQPYITGHHHVMFLLPETLFGIDGDYGTSSAQNWLMATCEGFTPHTSTINMGDVMGIGQTGASFPISRSTNREFSLTFREYQNLPILSIIRSWHSLFEPHVGVKTLPLPQTTYKGIVIIAIVKPSHKNGAITKDDLEEGYVYNGVYPVNCPDEITGSEQSSNESAQANITFKFDGAPLDIGMSIAGVVGVADLIVKYFNDYKYTDTYNQIGVGI